MQLDTLGDVLGFTNAEVALFFGGIALVYAIKRWRTLVVKQQKAQERQDSETTPRSRTLEAGEHAPTGNALSVREVASELSSLLSELEETSRRVAAQIENRKMALEILLREADEKIKRLEALTRGTSSAANSPNNLGFPANRPTDSRLDPKPSPLTTAAQEAALTLSRLRQERGAPVPTEDPAYRPIYQMADLGKSPREIATELGRQPGEVELILALRSRQRVG